ncbi:MAG TPA: non-homologous end-joining DNA ligase [Acidiferrobacterales bacterium]|nr:non-homologous end-joining DNA ligase [Acidiferrobacterales bacterium]
MSQVEVEIQGKRLKLSNLEKVLYPAAGFTKAQVIDYYTRIAPVLLPHLKNRPLTLKRYPEGVENEFFYEKECPPHRPPWVHTTPVWSEGNARDTNYCLIDDLPTLVWTANLADIELHTSLSLITDINRPTILAFDLDPGAPANILDCAQVAGWIHEALDELKLKSFAKTSGSKGLQVYVPLNTPISYNETKPFAHGLAGLLEAAHPRYIVSNMRKNLRKGKIFIDWSQNDAHKTTVCVYSLRARARPMVSTPVNWDEIETSWRKQEPLEFDYQQVLRRAEMFGDLFAPVLKIKQRLPELSKLKL